MREEELFMNSGEYGVIGGSLWDFFEGLVGNSGNCLLNIVVKNISIQSQPGQSVIK